MLTEKSQALEQMIIVATFTTFMGQIYMSPFGSEFRLTLAVVVLNVLMLTFRNIKPMPTIILVGILMFLVRSIVHMISNTVPFIVAGEIYYPVLFFYLFYAIFFDILNVRENLKRPVILFLSIWICDSIPNIIEVMIRQEWQHNNFEKIVLTLVSIGLIRTLFTTVLIYISNFYYEHVKKRQNYQKFKEKIVMHANLKTELFFLRKSKKDIESAMQKSFEVYEALPEQHLKEALLDVTKDIHEIKKDYTRVIAGIEKTIEETSSAFMPIHDIFNIAIETNKKLSDKQNKRIRFRQVLQFKGQTDAYYLLLSILNNLLANAIEAIASEGLIELILKHEKETILITVKDNGHGVTEEDYPLIFKPGYSTKYNEVNGIMASGIGLTHVKYLVEDVLEGTITVTSDPMEGTCFDISIPKKRILPDTFDDRRIADEL